MAVFQLQKDTTNNFICPKCGKPLHFVDGQAVQIVQGRADMSAVLPKYECYDCGIYFQELLGSGFYDEHDLPKTACPPQKAKKVVNTGDLPPMVLQRDANNQCVCPRCGEMMDYIEGRAVQLVDGRPDMENVKGHFHCKSCSSYFRPIASTQYYQWSEK
ncbi:MAG: hypothetical protein IIT82_07620 [Selenomonas sp.]|jgi:Zn finger protein HypA/HybF involved in hydrogenase expression|nr:hypothetical protein [Selenomonas sp.]MBQ1808961.1 hypothetical protein [Selenomonas sp.]MBQ1920560.1 hypothetical protein [Selenomonas sp.]MBQ2087841.1 hypothetical protein [Selenomonas sp.]MBQ4212104.1 hypothetical protein [Selenomonas sp.]